MSKVIVITGASEGIGAALARRLARSDAKLVLAARRADLLEQVANECGAPARALGVVTDVTKRDEVNRLLSRAIDQFGHVDVWVNNAGRGISKSVLQLDDDDVDAMISANVKSALYGMQAVVPHFKSRGAGHLVNVSSVLSRVPLAPMRSAYSAAKHALNSLTANVRHELQSEYPRIHVSLVLPGVVATGFGNNSLGGGVDSRAIPNAQPVDEVAEVMFELLEHPVDEVYTRPAYLEQVAQYFRTTER